MEKLKWEKTYYINVKEIDLQHEKFFSIINDLIEGKNNGELSREELGKILYSLVKYTKFHFETEERYMDKYEYDDSKEHKIIHIKFKEEIANLSRKFLNNKQEIDDDLIEYLKLWIVDHILNTDKNLGRFLKTKGIAILNI